MIVLAQLGQLQMFAKFDVAEKPETRPGRDGVEDFRDGLDLQVIGRHPAAHQPERRRQPIVHIHFDDEVWFA